MNLSFNYYHKLDDVELYLCNPDGRELFPISSINRNITLRFNDLSTLEFNVPSRLNKSDGTVIFPEYYDDIRVMRLIYATKIGWFKIVNVDENDDGLQKSKTVSAESLQSTFKDKGFFSEEKVYKFYDPNDPLDEKYTAEVNSDDKAISDAAVPSVVGQLSSQLGVRLDLSKGLDQLSNPYEEWTITYISPSLYFNDLNPICRTFSEEVTYAYDWMINNVEDAFEVIFSFDFLNKAIQIKTVSEVAQKSNLCLSFNNFMKNIEVSEDASDIVTVLSCNGDGLNITNVNSTGTNYIVDFSYYMDEISHKWMSNELIAKLKEWETAVNNDKELYTKYIMELRGYYLTTTESNTRLTELSTELQDLKNARDEYIKSQLDDKKLSGIVLVESVKVGETSNDIDSDYHDVSFKETDSVTAHKTQPKFNAENMTWYFDDAGTQDTATNNFNNGNFYFIDSTSGKSYCKLTGEVSIDASSNSSTSKCGGFVRYVENSNVNKWIVLKEKQVSALNETINSEKVNIDNVTSKINEISSRLNLLKYLSGTPDLLKELYSYWIEGDYNNKHISVLESTTPEEEIDLANELMKCGKIELSKVSQPRYSFTLEASNLMNQHQFKSQMREIELGKVISVEKADGLWYYPVLLEMSFNLDDSSDFSLGFANSFKLDDWGYTYADLISDSSSTSRKVSANWQDLMSYSKDRTEVNSLIKNPLDTTLRAAYANLVNQEFVVDDTGILGRKFTFQGSDEFEGEQIRMLNNVILFTDDGWETIKTALGKIYYTDAEGNNRTEYGLIGETIIGKLIMGEKLEISNNDSTVNIDGKGILIKRKNIGEDGSVSYETMFSADSETGKLFVHEAEITGDIKGGTININDNFKVDKDGNVVLNGSVIFGADNSPSQAVYASKALTKPQDGKLWSSFPDTSDTEWHKTFTEGKDYYGSYTYDGGQTWTSTIQVVGINGDKGVSVVSITELYQASTDPKVAPTGEWLEKCPEWQDGYYIWTKSKITYSEGSPTYTDPICATGSKGSNGNGVKSVDVWYYLSTSPTRLEGGIWSTSAPAWEENKFMWSKTVTSYTDGTTPSSSKPVCISGSKGSSGTSIETKYLYYLSNDSTAPSTPSYQGRFVPEGWSLTPPSMDENHQYIYVSQCTITDGTYGAWSTPTCWAKYGVNGNNGISVSTRYLYYKSNSAVPPDAPKYNGTSSKPPTGWSWTPESVDANYPYVYVSQCIVTGALYDDWSTPTLWAKFGADGSDAEVTGQSVFDALTNNGTIFGCFQGVDNKLYINAEFINTGVLKVSDGSNDIFVADITQKAVNIGGWKITSNAIMHQATAGGLVHDGVGMSSSNVKRPSLWQVDSDGRPVYSPVVFYAGSKDDLPYPDSKNDTYFGVLQDGSLYTAAIEAVGGTIGGWEITSNTLFAQTTKSDGTILGTGLQIQNTGAWAIAVGYTDYDLWNTAPFRVSHSGTMYANDAHIRGVITNKDDLGWGVQLISNRIEFLQNSKVVSKMFGSAGYFDASGRYNEDGLDITSLVHIGGDLVLGGPLGLNDGNGIYINGVLALTAGQIKVQTTTMKTRYLLFKCGILSGISDTPYQGIPDYSDKTYTG